MSFNSERWVKVGESPYIDHKNKPPIDLVVQELKETKGGVYPKIPIQRDENGRVKLRDELLSSPAVTFQSTVNVIAEQFTRLIELFKNIRL